MPETSAPTVVSERTSIMWPWVSVCFINGCLCYAITQHVFQCPDSASKKDLLAYLQRIALYCQQLNITSKVKADVQNVSGELIVSGVRLIEGNSYHYSIIHARPF